MIGISSVVVRSLVAAVALSLAACEHETDSEAAEDEASAEQDWVQAEPFVERFEALNEDFWFVSDGWSGGDWTSIWFRRDQLAWGEDGLSITLERAPDDAEKLFYSGEVRVQGRYQYGYFEGQMQVPKGSGLVTGLFTYIGSFFGQPHDEIDFEILGKDTTQVSITYFSDGESIGSVLPLGFDASEGMHIYGFEWAPDYIRWYVDGELVLEERGDKRPLPQHAQIFYAGLWNSTVLTDWVGPVDLDGGPWVLRIACMAQAPSYPGRPICADPPD